MCQLCSQVIQRQAAEREVKMHDLLQSPFLYSGPQYSNIVMDNHQTMDLKEAKVKIDTSSTPGTTNCDLDYLNSNSGQEETSKPAINMTTHAHAEPRSVVLISQ